MKRVFLQKTLCVFEHSNNLGLLSTFLDTGFFWFFPLPVFHLNSGFLSWFNSNQQLNTTHLVTQLPPQWDWEENGGKKVKLMG